MLAGRAASAQKETVPQLYHLGTERGKGFLSKQAGSSTWDGPCRAAVHGKATAGGAAGRCHGLSTFMDADGAAHSPQGP